jgi:hypothetical protein
MELRCRPDDLAVIVFAENTQNIGLIVRVLKRHCGRGRFAVQDKGPLWSVACAQHMTYKLGDEYIARKRGPVPDAYMQPIRGDKLPVESTERSSLALCTPS